LKIRLRSLCTGGGMEFRRLAVLARQA
jgi:hypothetical protein